MLLVRLGIGPLNNFSDDSRGHDSQSNADAEGDLRRALRYEPARRRTTSGNVRVFMIVQRASKLRKVKRVQTSHQKRVTHIFLGFHGVTSFGNWNCTVNLEFS